MWVVSRDGVKVSPTFATENEAWVWLQRHQSMSVDWALRYEGYAIREEGGVR